MTGPGGRHLSSLFVLCVAHHCKETGQATNATIMRLPFFGLLFVYESANQIVQNTAIVFMSSANKRKIVQVLDGQSNDKVEHMKTRMAFNNYL